MKKIVCTLLLCLGSILLCGCVNNGNYSKIKKLVEDNRIKFIAKETENWTEEVEIVSYGATGVIMTNRTVLDFYGTIIVQYLYIEWNKNDAYISFEYTQDGREQSCDYEKTSVLKQYIKEGKVHGNED